MEVILRADLREVFPLATQKTCAGMKPLHLGKQCPPWKMPSRSRVCPGVGHRQGTGSGAVVLGDQAGPLPSLGLGFLLCKMSVGLDCL